MIYFISQFAMILALTFSNLLVGSVEIQNTKPVVTTPERPTASQMQKLVEMVERYDPDNHFNRGVILRRIRETDLQMVLTNRRVARRGRRRYTITISYSQGRKKIQFWRRPYGTVSKKLLLSFDDNDLNGEVDFGLFYYEKKGNTMIGPGQPGYQNRKYLFQLMLDRAVKDCLQILQATKPSIKTK